MDQADRALNALSAKQMLKVNLTEEGEACMNIFFKACGYETGVHEVQTMWFECMSAKAYFRLKNWRGALNEFHWIDKHTKAMVDNQYDYYCYAIRKYALKAFEEQCDFSDRKLFYNRYVSRAALGYLQLDKKLHSKKAELLEAFSSEYETYIESQEYTDLQEKLAKSNDDDDYKQDHDPKGFQLYKDYLEGKFSIEPYVTKVVKRNWQDADLHAKAVDFYIRNGKFMLALKSAVNLQEKHTKNPKTPRAIYKIQKAYLQLVAAGNIKETLGDERLVEVVSQEME